MDNLNLSKVNVSIEKPYTATEPVRFRRYTITHLEDPAIVDLSISPYFYNLDLKEYPEWLNHWVEENSLILHPRQGREEILNILGID